MKAEEQAFWHFASEESLKRVWDNDADAVYDEWEKLYGKKH